MLPQDVNRALLLILSGPAGSGKTTLCAAMLEAFQPRLQRVITSTTRPRREGEKDGVDYYFFDPPTFENEVKSGAFYEWAQVHNHRYGSLKSEIQGKLAKNIDLLLSIDVQGAASFREAAKTDALLAPHLVTIFIQPQDIEQLRDRLQKRGDDEDAEIARRLKTAARELKQSSYYDYCITSRTQEDDFAALRDFYLAEKRRISEGAP